MSDQHQDFERRLARLHAGPIPDVPRRMRNRQLERATLRGVLYPASFAVAPLIGLAGVIACRALMGCWGGESALPDILTPLGALGLKLAAAFWAVAMGLVATAMMRLTTVWHIYLICLGAGAGITRFWDLLAPDMCQQVLAGLGF